MDGVLVDLAEAGSFEAAVLVGKDLLNLHHARHAGIVVNFLREAIGDDLVTWERALSVMDGYEGDIGQLERTLRRELKLRGGVLPPKRDAVEPAVTCSQEILDLDAA